MTSHNKLYLIVISKIDTVDKMRITPCIEESGKLKEVVHLQDERDRSETEWREREMRRWGERDRGKGGGYGKIQERRSWGAVHMVYSSPAPSPSIYGVPREREKDRNRHSQRKESIHTDRQTWIEAYVYTYNDKESGIE